MQSIFDPRNNYLQQECCLQKFSRRKSKISNAVRGKSSKRETLQVHNKWKPIIKIISNLYAMKNRHLVNFYLLSETK